MITFKTRPSSEPDPHRNSGGPRRPSCRASPKPPGERTNKVRGRVRGRVTLGRRHGVPVGWTVATQLPSTPPARSSPPLPRSSSSPPPPVRCFCGVDGRCPAPVHPTELNPFSQQVNNTHLAALDCLKLVVVAIASPVDERLTTLGRGVVVERRDCAAAPADLGGLVAERVARGRNKRGIGPSSGDTELRARRVACLLGLKRVVVCDTPAVNELLARLARFVVEPGRERGTTKSLSRYRKRRGSGEGTVQSARPTPPRRSAKSPATMSGSRENVQIRTGSAGSEQKLELVGSGGNPGMGRSVGRSVGSEREAEEKTNEQNTYLCRARP